MDNLILIAFIYMGEPIRLQWVKAHSVRRSIKFCQSGGGGGGGSNFDTFFLDDEGRDDPNTTKSGPSSACERNTI